MTVHTSSTHLASLHAGASGSSAGTGAADARAPGQLQPETHLGDPDDQLQIEPLAPWHLPLLSDPTFVPLQPLLQRAVLLGPPQQLLQWLQLSAERRPPQVLLARRGQTPLGLIVSGPMNRSASCWQVRHLRLAVPSGKRQLAGLLLRQAIGRATGASSWMATSSSLDLDRLAALREQGFQPLRTERIWRWQGQLICPSNTGEGSGASGELPLRPLNRRTAAALLQLEQAACPALLRQLLDRRCDDLLDQSRGRGWLLLDNSRNQAVAALRWLGDHAGGGHDLELTVHPGWGHLVGAATGRLLAHAHHALGTSEALWLRSDSGDLARERWLQQLGAEERGERVLMARSVWRRQELTVPARQASRRLEAVLEQLQPGRRPLPTPVSPR
jgi:hypothetical protein